MVIGHDSDRPTRVKAFTEEQARLVSPPKTLLVSLPHHCCLHLYLIDMLSVDVIY